MKTKLLLLSILFTQFLVAQNVTFTEVDTPFEGVYGGSIAFADMDHNGTQDVLIAGQSDNGPITKLYISDENGNFTEVSGTPFAGVSDCSIALVSLINDGWHDVIITGTSSDGTPVTKVYYNNGGLYFNEELGNVTEGVKQGSVSMADVNGDSFPDALITGTNSNNNPIAKLYKNNGNGAYLDVIDTPFDGVYNSSVAFADVDGDGDQDALITGGDNEGNIIAKLYTNDGLGNFTEVTNSPFEGILYSSIAFADVDGDGDQDVLITGENVIFEQISKLYTNDGLGNFTEVSDTPFDGVHAGSIAFADVDNDTDQDVLITGQSGVDLIAKLYTNDGLGNFTEVSDTPFDGVYVGSIALADVDGDSDQDALITGVNNEGDEIAKLYFNDLIISTNDLKVDLSIGISSFPNPTALNYINIVFQSTEKAQAFMRVFDMKGNLVLQHNENIESGQQTIKLNIASLSAGSYFVELNNGKTKGVAEFVVQ